MQRQQITGSMPDHYCLDDAKFINQKLSILHEEERVQVCIAYSKVYQHEYEAEEIEFKKENKARREANIRLRNFIEKRLKTTLY